MRWLEITVNTKPEEIELLAETLEELGIQGLVIEDEAEYSEFLENNRQYWDYIDEELEKSIKGLSRIKFYFEDSPEGEGELARIEKALPDRVFTAAKVRDEDWENNWRQYYKPINIGKSLLVVPEWEAAPDAGGRHILKLEPGLIFGTGTHATTRMCLEAIEDMAPAGKTVLDLGCGSGILGIAALVLGAESAVGCDIDPKAPDVVTENGKLNGFGGEKLTVYAGDILSDPGLKRTIGGRKYDIVLANIVADVIIALAPDVKDYFSERGVFICSGIIDGRENEVSAALLAGGLEITDHFKREDWHCFKAVRKDS